MRYACAAGIAMCLSMSVGGAALAAGKGTGSGQTMANGRTVMSAATSTGARGSASGARSASTAYGVSSTTRGTSTGTMQSGTYGSTQATGTGTAGLSGAGSNNVYSPARPAPVVPLGARVMATTVNGVNRTVTYVSGATTYQVTYAPNGRYTYTTSGARLMTAGATGMSSPSASTGTTGTTSFNGTTLRTGATGTASAGGAGTSLSVLPRTGGAYPGPANPGIPIVPLLPGLALVVAGACLRAVRR